MYNTRSKKDIMLGDEVKGYFGNLLRPLATITYLDELFEKFKNEVVAKFELQIIEQERKKLISNQHYLHGKILSMFLLKN